jgi:Ca-activated chloride channel family protein
MKQWLILSGLVVVLTACGSSAARYNNQGNQDFSKQQYDQAIENYRTAQQENPDLAEPYYNAGNTRYRQNDLKGAEAQLQQSLRDAGEPLQPQAFYNLGNAYFRGQDLDKAIEAYKQALRLKPDDADAKHNLELALQQQQQQQQQQNQQSGGGQQPQQNQQDQQNQQGQPPPQNQQGDQQQPNGGGGQGQQPDQSNGGQSPNQQNQSGGGSLSRQEAEQFLDALKQDSQTLQERLQQQVGGQVPPPDKDW